MPLHPNCNFTGSNATAPYTFTYTINGGAPQTVTSVGNIATVSVPTTTAGTFVYDLVSVQDASSTLCNQTQTGSVTVIVNPLPTATITGDITVCRNSPPPVVTFTGASGTAPYTFTYNINGGPNQVVVSGNNCNRSGIHRNSRNFCLYPRKCTRRQHNVVQPGTDRYSDCDCIAIAHCNNDW